MHAALSHSTSIQKPGIGVPHGQWTRLGTSTIKSTKACVTRPRYLYWLVPSAADADSLRMSFIRYTNGDEETKREAKKKGHDTLNDR